MVLDGRSDKEIRDYYVRQYGQQVLAEPEGTRRLMLYGIPVTVTVAGAVFVIMFLRRAVRIRNAETQATRTEVQPDPAALRKVRVDSSDL